MMDDCNEQGIITGTLDQQKHKPKHVAPFFPRVREITNSVGVIMPSPTRHLPLVRLRPRDHVKTFLLLYLSLVTLPISLAIALLLTKLPPAWSSRLLPFCRHTPAFAAAYRRERRSAPGFRERTVLVTGISMTKGLTLARAFYLAGHRVVGADFGARRSSVWLPACLGGRRFSCSCFSVYNLRRPQYTAAMSDEATRETERAYAEGLINIMSEQRVVLWVSCSGVATALEDGLARSMLGGGDPVARVPECAQFDLDTTKKLHEKSSFVQRMRELHLPVPVTSVVVSQAQAWHLLMQPFPSKNNMRFILKPVGMDDVHRGNMTLLPLPAEPGTEIVAGQATDIYVSQLPISKEHPWILQQFISGNREYCTHALVVDGEVKVFVACPSSDMLMHYRAMPTSDPLRKQMLRFTQAVAREEHARATKEGGNAFTGHLSFDFMVEEDAPTGLPKMYAIECNPRAHTAVALFSAPGPEMDAMVGAYTAMIRTEEPPRTSSEYQKWHLEQLKAPATVRPPEDAVPRYWLGHDLVVLLLLPLLKLVVWPFSLASCAGSVREFVQHVLFWKEGVFEAWDPWPFVALYHVYWPMAIGQAWWRGERWSRVNVSTTKMFAC